MLEKKIPEIFQCLLNVRAVLYWEGKSTLCEAKSSISLTVSLWYKEKLNRYAEEEEEKPIHTNFSSIVYLYSMLPD